MKEWQEALNEYARENKTNSITSMLSMDFLLQYQFMIYGVSVSSEGYQGKGSVTK